MIFRRKKDVVTEEPTVDDVPADEVEQDEVEPDESAAAEQGAEEDAEQVGDLDVETLDAADWRADGPFDITEIESDDDDDDLEDEEDAASDGVARIDLGSLILTGFEGMELRLQMAEQTQQLVSAMMINGDSALELAAYAAPRSGGLWAELRDEMMEQASENGGSASMVEGPFGVELRRLLQVTTPDGEQGYQPSRMWVVEGPRWLLRGIVYGQAALEEGIDPPVEALLNAFRSVVVRRGQEAKAPGDLLPLSLPENLVPAQADEDQ